MSCRLSKEEASKIAAFVRDFPERGANAGLSPKPWVGSTMSENVSESPRQLGRYALYAEIASGGMATVHIGRLLGPVGFSRIVALNRLHQHVAKDPEFVTMFLDEARIAARIRHPNVVPTLDVAAADGEVFLVMEYVEGEAL